MRCPKCGKDVELQNKQVGVDENDKPIFNEYAICKDCKKQWNLDKQREKKAANTNASNHIQPKEKVQPKTASAAAKNASARQAAPTQAKPAAKKEPVRKDASENDIEKAVAKKKTAAPDGRSAAPAQKPAAKPAVPIKKAAPAVASAAKNAVSANETGVPANAAKAPVKKAAPTGKPAPGGRPVAAKKPAPGGTAGPASRNATGRPVPRKRPASTDADSHRPVKAEEEQRYSNIPPEKVRVKRENAVKDNYEDMLAADPTRKPVKKKKTVASEDSAPKKRTPTASDAPSRKKTAAQPVQKAPHKEEEPMPKFRLPRIIFGIISIAAFAFFAYKGFLAGLSNISAGSNATTGMIYIVLALCMLVAGLLLLIMQKKHTIFAFVLPMIFYLGGAVFAFLKRAEDKFLLYGAIVGAILAVIFLILTIMYRSGNEDGGYEDDYDDPFEEDHDNY